MSITLLKRRIVLYGRYPCIVWEHGVHCISLVTLHQIAWLNFEQPKKLVGSVTSSSRYSKLQVHNNLNLICTSLCHSGLISLGSMD